MRKFIIATGVIMAASAAFAASPYTVHNLVADIPNPAGTADPNVQIDPNIVDPWGIAIGASSPFWLSNAGTGLATVYSYSPTANPQITVTATKVTVPNASGGLGRVTGQITGTGAGI